MHRVISVFVRDFESVVYFRPVSLYRDASPLAHSLVRFLFRQSTRKRKEDRVKIERKQRCPVTVTGSDLHSFLFLFLFGCSLHNLGPIFRTLVVVGCIFVRVVFCAVYMCATRCCGNNFFCSQTEIKHSMWIDKIIRLTGVFLPFSHSRIVCVCVCIFFLADVRCCWNVCLETFHTVWPIIFFLKANNAQELCFCSSLCVFVCNGIHALVLIIGRDTKKLQINKEEGKKPSKREQNDFFWLFYCFVIKETHQSVRRILLLIFLRDKSVWFCGSYLYLLISTLTQPTSKYEINWEKLYFHI